jgi:multidrug efflux pump subunit AcrA (membrane-fusion protein)
MPLTLATLSPKKKKIIGLAALILVGGGYFAYSKFTTTPALTRYVISPAQLGTVSTAISGSGQVSVSNQTDIKSKVSGDILTVPVTEGQEVKEGTVIAQINPKDVAKAVRDASSNLQSAKLTLQKLQQPNDQLSLLQAKNAVAQSQDALTSLKLSQQINYQKALAARQTAEDTLSKTYRDGFTTVTNAFLALPDVMSGLQSTLFDTTFSRSQQNIDWYANQISDNNLTTVIKQYKDQASDSYTKARASYDRTFANYKITGSNSSTSTIETLILESYQTTQIIGEAVKNIQNFISYIQDQKTLEGKTLPSGVSTQLTSLNSYTGTVSSNAANLLSIKQTIENSKNTIVNTTNDLVSMNQNNPLDLNKATQTISEREAALAKLKVGADPLDIKSAELSIQERLNALLDAQQQYADYTIRALYDGIIAKLNIKKGDSLSSGFAVATLITKQKTATITLNEVDAAKIKIGQKTILTFDALPDLNITGHVTAIDTIGTVSQGVVSYNVTLVFDTQEASVKPGMTISATIVTETHPNVLTIPNAAVKTQGTAHYVDVVNSSTIQTIASTAAGGVTLSTPPERRLIQIGLVGDDATEITSGLNPDDLVVVNTIAPSTAAKAPAATTLNIPGLGGGGFGGGANRALRGG